MICPWFVDIDPVTTWYKNDHYIIFIKYRNWYILKYSILTNHGHIINFTEEAVAQWWDYSLAACRAKVPGFKSRQNLSGRPVSL